MILSASIGGISKPIVRLSAEVNRAMVNRLCLVRCLWWKNIAVSIEFVLGPTIVLYPVHEWEGLLAGVLVIHVHVYMRYLSVTMVLVLWGLSCS